MNVGGLGACGAEHVRLISLPLLMNNSEFPRMIAFETDSRLEKYQRLIIIWVIQI
jgi:hypothetical protein